MENLELIRIAFLLLQKKRGEGWFKTYADYEKVKDNPGVKISCNLAPGVLVSFSLLADLVGIDNPASRLNFCLESASYIMEEIEALLSVEKG